MLPIAADIANRLTRSEAHSALPDAPVVQEALTAPRPPGQHRAWLAQTLRRVADRLEPAPPRAQGLPTCD